MVTLMLGGLSAGEIAAGGIPALIAVGAAVWFALRALAPGGGRRLTAEAADSGPDRTRPHPAGAEGDIASSGSPASSLAAAFPFAPDVSGPEAGDRHRLATTGFDRTEAPPAEERAGVSGASRAPGAAAAQAVGAPAAGAEPVRPRRPEMLAEWRAARRPAVEGARPTYVVRRALLPEAGWVGEDADGQPAAGEPAPAVSVAAAQDGAPSAAPQAGADTSGEAGAEAVGPVPSAAIGQEPPASAVAGGETLRQGEGAALPADRPGSAHDASPAAAPGPDPVEALLAAIAAKLAQDRTAGGDGAEPAAAGSDAPAEPAPPSGAQEPGHQAVRAGSPEDEARSEAASARDEETQGEDAMGAFRRVFAELLACQDGMPARPPSGAGHPTRQVSDHGEGEPRATGEKAAPTVQADAASPDASDGPAPASTSSEDVWMWDAAGDGAGAAPTVEPILQAARAGTDTERMPEAPPGITAADPAGLTADGAADAHCRPEGTAGDQAATNTATATQAPLEACPDGPDEAGTSIATPPSGPDVAGPGSGASPTDTVAACDTPQAATPAGMSPAMPETAGAAGGCPVAEPASGEEPGEDVASRETSDAGSDADSPAVRVAGGVTRRDDDTCPDPAPVVPLRLHPSELPQELAGLVARLEQPPTVVEGPVATGRRTQGAVSVAAMLAERRARIRPRPVETGEQDFRAG